VHGHGGKGRDVERVQLEVLSVERDLHVDGTGTGEGGRVALEALARIVVGRGDDERRQRSLPLVKLALVACTGAEVRGR
jgi:hypothetical protein